MELKEYLLIIKRDRKVFVAAIIAVVVFAFAFFYLQKPFYQVSLSLNITRSGSQETQEYKYDDYYRLQADEKFVETVVQWLKDPRIAANIMENAGIKTEDKNLAELRKSIKSEKLSSQMIAISFPAPDKKTAESISSSIIKVISENTKNLNNRQKEQTWFEILGNEPIIKEFKPNGIMIFFGSFFLGIFLGFWIVLVRHYLR